MAIYTKTGDKGSTGNFKGKRMSKSSKPVRTIGVIDELNSFLGMVGNLTEIQENLFIINSILAGSKLRFSKTETKKLEKQIDKWEGELPVQTNFIFYGGTSRAALLFYARALCRRAERSLVSLGIERKAYGILQYINRLSDYLFMLARHENFRAGIKEKFWKSKPKT